METKVLLKAGKRMVPVILTKEGSRIFFKFGFNKPLMAEIKDMQGSKYHGYDEDNPRKIWSIPETQRNLFQLKYLAHPGADDPENPYARFDRPYVEFTPKRSLYNHQIDLSRHGLTVNYGIWSAEMGVGKTLAAIEVAEKVLPQDFLWVGPKSALTAVKLEFKKWKSFLTPSFVTYEGLKKMVTDWPAGKKSPQVIIFDEASRLKNWSAQRTQAAAHLANAVRAEWGDQGYVILMSGSPAPKSPADWWSLCEIACPGFLKEGTVDKFKRRLAIIESKELFQGGGSYAHLVAWRDDERRCNICGLMVDDVTHSEQVDAFAVTATNHVFTPSVNEVARLYKRMVGLVNVKFKKDCIQLPDKIYRIIHCKPTRSILNAAKAIQITGSSSIERLTLLRELSDGFQYKEEITGRQPCPQCDSLGYVNEIACDRCNATGSINTVVRTPVQIPCPKEDALNDLLDEHDEIGRIVVYGGFTGSVDRICSVVQKAGWKFIRVDGRGWFSDLPTQDAEELLEIFQSRQTTFERVAFVGQPGAAGMGLTLTASPTIVYYSNDFNAESRIQSEDRIHRLGSKGATIIDLFHLPSDELVYNNLKQKRRLQDISMGQLKAMFDEQS